MNALFCVIFKSFTKSCLVNAYRLFAEVLYDIFAHICRNADDFHEVHVEVTLRMFNAADTHLVSVDECKYMELLVLCILLADLFELKATERDVHLRVLAEYVFFPAISLCIQTWLLNDIVLVLRIVDYRLSSILVHALLTEISVDRALLAVEVKTEVVVHFICI